MERSTASRHSLSALVGPSAGRPRRAAERGAGPQRIARILFAFGQQVPSARGVQRVLELARLLDSELHALHVTPARLLRQQVPAAVDSVPPAGSSLAPGWLARALSGERAGGVLQTRVGGSFVEQVAEHARELEASLVITSAEAVDGASLIALAHAARLPVIGARDRARGEAIVAATDLVDRSYPVLSTAQALSTQLAAPLIALHNLSPFSVLSAVDLILQAPEGPVCALGELARRRLERALLRLPGHARPVLASEADAVEAILREAHASDVGLIAVGTRRYARTARSASHRTPARVIERARCSVLVVPIQEGRPAREERARTP